MNGFSQTYSSEQVREDIGFLKNQLIKLHPDPYKYVKKEQFDSLFEAINTHIVGRYTLRETYFTALPLVQAIRCGHTFLIPDKRLLSKNTSYDERPKYFPLSVRLINDRLFVARNYSAEKKINRGTEILEIDGQPIKKILENLEKISFYNGDGINPTARKYYTVREFRKLYYLWKGEESSFLIHYKKSEQDKPKTIKLDAQNAFFMEKMLETRYPDVDEDTTGIVSYRLVDSVQKVAMLDVRSFMYDLGSFSKGNFEGETRKIFRKLSENKIENLILDLRGNSGGVLEYSIFLLRFFANQPFEGYKLGFKNESLQKLKQDYKKFEAYYAKEATSRLNNEFTIKSKDGYLESKYQTKQRPHDEFRFDKNVYVLMNGGTFSAAALVVSKLHNMGIGTYVGMACGGAYDGCSAAQFSKIQLPNSELEISIPLGRIQYAVDAEKYKKNILEPDFEVNTNVDDFLKNEDTVLKFTLNLIKNKVKVR